MRIVERKTIPLPTDHIFTNFSLIAEEKCDRARMLVTLKNLQQQTFQ